MAQDLGRGARPAVGSARDGALTSILLGQLIALLITGTGVFASSLAEDGVNIPAVQSALNYILLCLHLVFAWPWAKGRRPAAPTWRYAFWALADVEANYLVTRAYQYTSVASVMLLDCFAIPCVLLCSRLVLGARYGLWHVLACAICVNGLALTVLSDVQTGKVGPAPSGPAWFGDMLVLAGAALYGISNVQQELLLKRGGSERRSEALGLLGLWGTVIGGVQAVVLEHEAVMHTSWTLRMVLGLAGFQACLFAMYVVTSRFLLRGDAALFNLSVLTSDVYSVLFAWRVQHQAFSWTYGLAFVTTLTGVGVYHTQPEPVHCSVEGLDREPLLFSVL